MAIVESESDLMMGWLMIRTFYNSPSIPDYSGKADALIRLKRAMRKFMREQPPCREWIVKDYYDGSCIQLEQLPDELDSYTEDEGVVHVESVHDRHAQPVRLHGSALHKLVQADPAAWSLVRIPFD